ncbi:gluconeogenesis factor YvcK family protein [Persephonella sp.]
MKVVTIGGGTGLSSLLRGIKHLVPDTIRDLSAIVTVADNGGSSGRLREEMQIPAPGDIRNCIVALGEDEDILTKVFQYRFSDGNGLKGHSFGNLFLSVLTKITGDFLDAVEITSNILKIKGEIIPSTDKLVDIVAEFSDGKIIKGETQITEYGKQLKGKIKKIWMDPSDVEAPEKAVRKIKEAEFIILGPGSLYTSIIPNLLVKDIRKAILESQAYKIYICNVMTQYGETDEYKASDHIKAIHNVVGEEFIDAAIINTTVPPPELIEKYMEEHSEPVTADVGDITRMGITVYAKDLLEVGNYVRHNPEKLTAALLEVMEKARV